MDSLEFARLSVVLAALVSPLVPGPAAAVDSADYLVWRFSAPGPRGLGLIHERASDTTLLAETVGLQSSSPYRYVGSAAPCSDTHRAADVIWARSFQSNGNGAALVDTTVADDAIGMVRSIRLFQGSSQSDCAKPLRYESGGTGQPTDAFARLNAFGARLLVFVDVGSPKDKLTAVGHGFIASHGYRLVAVDAQCPVQPTSGNRLFQKSGMTNSLGILWRHDAGTNLTGKTPRSIQLFNPSNERVACTTTTRVS